MKKHYLLLIVTVFTTLNVFAQTPGWQWAKRGGGITSLNGSTGNDLYSAGQERILDVAVDSDNNYYYLAEIGGNQVDYDDMTLETYNTNNSNIDIYIFSTDCEGDLRWDKIIGGGFNDRATSIGVDNDNNIFVSGFTANIPNDFPPHFDTDTVKTEPSFEGADPMKKSAFLIKYNQNGIFQWLREPEGINDSFTNGAILKTVVEPNGKTHSLTAFGSGTHLDGQLEVPEGEFTTTIVIYNPAGELQDFFEVDMQPGFNGFYSFQLAYDSNLNRYYISDTRRNSGDELSINGYGADDGDSDDYAFYLAALDNQGQVLWFKKSQYIYSYSNGDIEIDGNGDIYFTGQSSSDPDDGSPDSFAGYTFSTQDGDGVQAPFLVKLDSDGNLIWGTNSPDYSRFPGRGIALDGDDVYLGLGMLGGSWGELNVPGPDGAGLVPDPIIMRFDTETGTPQEVIHTPEVSVYQDMIMDIEVDGNGNIVAGGYFGNTLFGGSDNEIDNVGGDADFFIAQYGTGNCSLGTETETAKTGIKAYPNPTKGLLTLESSANLESYVLYDLQGRAVKSGKLQNNQLKLTGLETGMYFLRLSGENGEVETVKVVKK